jgi:hypothetical protein
LRLVPRIRVTVHVSKGGWETDVNDPVCSLADLFHPCLSKELANLRHPFLREILWPRWDLLIFVNFGRYLLHLHEGLKSDKLSSMFYEVSVKPTLSVERA